MILSINLFSQKSLYIYPLIILDFSKESFLFHASKSTNGSHLDENMNI